MIIRIRYLFLETTFIKKITVFEGKSWDWGNYEYVTMGVKIDYVDNKDPDSIIIISSDKSYFFPKLNDTQKAELEENRLRMLKKIDEVVAFINEHKEHYHKNVIPVFN